MSETLKIYGKDGSPVGEFTVEDRWIELEKGEQAVHDVVVAFLAGQRAGTASTKTRAEVHGSNPKPFRQKGTGRARAGSKKSPVWVGGGICFGPKPRSYGKKINKKVRTLALRRAFSEKLKSEAITVVDNLEFQDHKTKNATAVLKQLQLAGKVLVVAKDYDENLLLATGNIADTLLIKGASVNVYQLLRYRKILFTAEAIKEFTGRLG